MEVAPPRHRTLLRMLEWASQSHGDQLVRFPDAGRSLSLRDLHTRARIASHALRGCGVDRGSVAGIALPTGEEFLVALFGILGAGAAASCLPQPAPFEDLSAFCTRLQAIADDAGMRHAVVPDGWIERLRAALPRVAWIAAGELGKGAADVAPWSAAGDDLALVQYTSGSTAVPKGVALAHENVLAGIHAILHGIDGPHRDVLGLWLPLWHDMGLISTLSAVAAGIESVLWSPSSFIRDPARWLRDFAAAKASLYAGPDFSYAMLTQHVPAEEVPGLDLSSWRVAFNGGEPISLDAMQRFTAHFAAAGLAPSVLFPVYGLAEVTLAATFPEPGEGLRADWVDRGALAAESRVERVEPSHPRARAVVSVGGPVLRHRVRVVDAAGNELSGDRVGEIQVRGPAVMKGYHRRPDATAEAFAGGWLRTGDLGYLAGGRLHVTGRIRQMIVVHGVNHYPEDVEAAVAADGSRCIAVGLGDGNERIAVLVETAERDPEALWTRAGAIARRVRELDGLDRVDVHLLRRGAIRRTTSGKPRRLAMRDLLVSGALGRDTLCVLPYADGASVPPPTPIEQEAASR